MDQKRIDLCLATTLFQPEYSGAAIRFQRYQPGLRKRGVDMRVFTQSPCPRHSRSDGSTSADPNGAVTGNGYLRPVDYVDGIPVHRIHASGGSGHRQQVAFDRALTRYVDSNPKRPDLVQFLSLPLSSVPWLRGLRQRGIPLVLTHTMVNELSAKRWKREMQLRTWRLPSQMVDCVVASSGVMRDHLRRIGVTTRIEVIPNGVDLDRFNPATSSSERDELRQRQGHAADSELILSVGPITERKGVDLLAQAWTSLAKERPHARLVLVGPRHGETGNLLPGGAEFQAKVDRILRDSVAGDRVSFTGPVEDVEQYFKTADLFVFPSMREGMGNVVLEAFASGLPSILTPFIGLPEEFGEPGAQYVLADRTPEALATAMDALLDDPERRAQLSRQAREWAENRLGLDTALDQYADLYRELAGGAK